MNEPALKRVLIIALEDESFSLMLPSGMDIEQASAFFRLLAGCTRLRMRYNGKVGAYYTEDKECNPAMKFALVSETELTD